MKSFVCCCAEIKDLWSPLIQQIQLNVPAYTLCFVLGLNCMN